MVGVKKRGFKEAKQDALKALTDGRVQHEPRSTLNERNLLATGEVDATLTATLILATPSRCAASRPHHFLDLEVWVFRPSIDGTRWYIKFYFIDEIWFISVHRSDPEGHP